MQPWQSFLIGGGSRRIRGALPAFTAQNLPRIPIISPEMFSLTICAFPIRHSTGAVIAVIHVFLNHWREQDQN